MTKVLFGILLVLTLAIPINATEITAPEVLKSGQDTMPQNTDSFGDGLLELIQSSTKLLQSEWKSAVYCCSGILFTAALCSLLPVLSVRLSGTGSIAGTVMISTWMLQNTNTMIGYASEAVWEICEYGRLLCPVLTAAMAAQGGITASAALYAGTTAFITLLSTVISRWMIPTVYVFLAFSVAYSALGEETMKRFADSAKGLLHWTLKTILIGFATYMSITGVVSGTTDMAALKAAKVTISTVVPVVGGILSDASESVLISIGIMKNAAGIYGILAVLAIFTGPFVKIGAQYLLLKASAGLCGLFGNKSISSLVESFSVAMGLLLAMMASCCILILISTVCYLKGME